MVARSEGSGGSVPAAPTRWTADLVLEHVRTMIDANDRRYMDRFESSEKAVNAALAASEKAVSVAETNAEKWRDNANEWRGAMTDREARFVSHTEFGLLKERLDRAEGGGKGMRDLWGWIMAAIMLGIVIFNAFNK